MAWRKVLIWGAVASAATVGCKVTVNEGPFDGGFFEDAGTGGKGTGGSSAGGSSTGGSSTGGSSGSSGAGGSAGSSGGSSGSGGTKDAGTDATVTACHPEQDTPGGCPYCIETKCCQEWLDCVNDADCERKVGTQAPEFDCIQDCLTHDDAGIKDLDTCAGDCAHDSVGVSSATSLLIGCMRDTGTGDASNTQNCTNQCFLRDLP